MLGLGCESVSLAAPIAFDLKPHWDERVALKNPDKGWYHHYPDNHINKYRITRDSDLLEFPGMDHLYIRLSWAYLQPQEDRFDWPVIDDLIQKWTQHGLGIAFRISCKETSNDRIEQQFATPRWVMEAGAKGGYYRMGKEAGPDAPWEAVFDDPVFLQKLDHFLKAFAERYDGKPWLRYVDIGSLGDWGEGHTWAGSRKKYTFDQRKLHVDLYLKHFKKSLLMMSDDFVFETGGPEERRRMHQYVVDHGISYRDDSILVDGYFQGQSATATVRSPEFFADTFERLPTVLELEHYSAVKKAGNWTATANSSIAKYGGGRKGPDMLREALGLLHATYIGYHGDAAEWLNDNRQLSDELLNRCGYWYFLHRVELPEGIKAGGSQTLRLTWENRGVAPAYRSYQLLIMLEGPENIELTFDSANRKWMPGKTQEERHTFTLPQSTKSGDYMLKLKLQSAPENRDVYLALDPRLLDSKHLYKIGVVKLEQ